MIRIDEQELALISGYEDRSIDLIKKDIQEGRTVFLKNSSHQIEKPCCVGKGLRVKVNANIGMSPGHSDEELEVRKMRSAVSAGADAVMDLSTGSGLKELRKRLLAECPVPLGTVPVYEIACNTDKDFSEVKESAFIDVLKQQAQEGVDFFTIHSGIDLRAVKKLERHPRILNVVSRGGALLASWMEANGRENPFITHFDEVIDIAREYRITLSLGDSLRPGAIADATDELQIQELINMGEQQKKALAAGVQVMIEGPGHVKLDEIETNVKIQKALCHGAPFYVLGPLVTDAAMGHDHIAGAIGGALAALYGADFLCYVTPAEHVRLPDEEDVRKGVIASRIASHAADLAKGLPSAAERDRKISRARAARDWEEQFSLGLDPDTARIRRKSAEPEEKDVCSMCGDFCSIKVLEKSMGKKDRKGIK